MTAVTVVVVEAEAEAVAISAAVGGGVGSVANGSEICTSEGAEASVARESVLQQRWRTDGREEKERTKKYTRFQTTKMKAVSKTQKSLKTEV